MHTIGDLIEKFGGSTKFAAIIGKNPSTASEMKRRGSIPVEYWPAVLSAARECGFKEVTIEKLMELHASPRRSLATQPAEKRVA